MTIKYLGHSCFIIEVDGVKIITDPMLIAHPNTQEKPEIAEVDIMLLSHGHEDHVADAVSIAKKTNCRVITNFEIGNWLTAQGVENVLGMNHGGATAFDKGRIKMVNAIHSSSMPDGSYGGNPAGFIIQTDEKNVYFAGDTALMSDMKIMGEYENIGLSILPIGDVFTMGIDDAIIACDFLNCKKVIGMHYDTFPPIEIDHEEAKQKFRNKGCELNLLEIGINTEI